MSRATRADVARLAGTSTAVVSYVVNDGPRAVRPETRDRVLAAVQKLGYKPNRIAAALSSNRTQLAAYVAPNATYPLFAELRGALEEEAFRRGYLMLTGSTQFDEALEASYINAFLSLNVDGLIVSSSDEETPLSIAADGGHAVYLHRYPASQRGRAVTVDNHQVGYTATQHLLEHGHRQVYCLTGAGHDAAASERVGGWRHALSDAGVTNIEQLLVDSHYSRAAAASATRDLLTTRDDVHAVYAVSDEHAIGVLSAAATLGVKTPGELAVVGSDGIHESAYTVPALTTVGLPIAEMAKEALARVLSETYVPRGEAELSELTRLHIRNSCGC